MTTDLLSVVRRPLGFRTRLLVAAFVALSAGILAATHFVYTPLQVDGAWYGYPGFALSQGRDPGESFAPIDLPIDDTGTRVNFPFDTRDLRTYSIAAWFQLFSPSIWSAKAYSLMELLVLVSVTVFVLRQNIGASWAAAIAGLMLLSDLTAVSLASADMRPDIAVAIFGVAVFGGAVMHRGSFSWQRSVCCVLLAAILAFVHLTSAVAFSVIGGAMAVDFLLNRSAMSIRRIATYFGVLAVGLVGLAFQRPVRELLVPTSFDPSSLYYPQPANNLALGHLAAKELNRWYNYFFDANVSILVALLVVTFFAVRILRTHGQSEKSSDSSIRLIAPLAFGLLCGIGVLAILDPHPASHHAFSVLVFAYLLSAYVLDAATSRNQHGLSNTLAALLVAAGLAKVLLATKIGIEEVEDGLSNATIRTALNEEVEKTGARVIIGPTMLWSYLKPSGSYLVLDRRTGDLRVLAPALNQVDLIVADEEYRAFNFVETLEQTYPQFEVSMIRTIGNVDAPDRLQLFTIHHRPQPAL